MDKRTEITKMMDEWRNETNGRSAFAIMHDEHHKIMFHCTGRQLEVITALASIIAQEKEIYENFIEAMLLVSRRAGLRERLKLAWTFLTGKW
ncbi:MAG: hypothetical protein UIC63_06445 [Bacteroidaceae bacterium]|nr:hypothetical protein [Bacteroidaceae bacterium]